MNAMTVIIAHMSCLQMTVFPGDYIVLRKFDTNPNTVTVKTDKFYAFALVYKDSVKTE